MMKPWRKQFGIWVPDRSLRDESGFISPGLRGVVAGSRRRSVFNAADYGTLEWWYGADQIVGLVNNDPITQWNDQSGNNRHLTSASGKQPLYKTNQQNSLPSALWDGTDDYLRYNTNFTQNYQSSLFVVLNQTTAGSKVWFVEGGTLYNACAFFFYGDNNGPWNYNSNAYSCTGVDNWLATGWRIVDVHYDGASAAAYYSNGGTAISNGTVSGTPGTGSQSNVLNVGARNGGASAFYQGHVGELFRYNAKLSAGNITACRNALAAKWGITVS